MGLGAGGGELDDRAGCDLNAELAEDGASLVGERAVIATCQRNLRKGSVGGSMHAWPPLSGPDEFRNVFEAVLPEDGEAGVLSGLKVLRTEDAGEALVKTQGDLMLGVAWNG